MDWQAIEYILCGIHSKRRGTSAWPPPFMFKALLLQSLHNLSDPGLEKQLARDLLFRRFVGLSLADSVPDHSTIWRFCQLLEKQDLMGALLPEVNRQLSRQGLYICSGEISMVDTSVIQAQRSRPNKDKDGNSTQDPEADYNVKQGSDGKRKTTYSFKAHINVDEDGFIKATAFRRGTCMIPITLHSYTVTQLLSDDESAVYAHSAYKSKKHELAC
jgi:IS5 family transposase